MSKVAMIVRSKAQPGKREEIRLAYEQRLAPRAEDNEAQELVLWAADEHDADAFYLVEVYRDRPAMEENGRAPWFFEYLGVVGPLLDGQPEVMTATPTWAKGIAL
ncbi:MAG TPA: hypothetical protein PKZ38_11595 [Dermatophilaceae bacterium]|nr:hypothetical protein [Dermatophilaceae bacterium]HRC00720.1 hypothetical protein [Dermatophilaceae bacterium]